MNEYLATAPFDLYELHLFHLVAQYRSFTRAAAVAGLTQSALSRQIQGMERKLGLPLLVRTTRSVATTEAGAFLEREARRLVGDVEHSLRRLREDFTGAKKIVRVGVSRTIGYAHLPGFFHANLRRAPEVGCRVSYGADAGLLGRIEEDELDLAVVETPRRLTPNLRITHRFTDDFILIAPSEIAKSWPASSPKKIGPWLANQSWLLPDEDCIAGMHLRRWIKQQGWSLPPTMELDSFDLIVNLVALGLGCGFVPIRTLALYSRKRGLTRLSFPKRFSRELVVVARRRVPPAAHVAAFVENILF